MAGIGSAPCRSMIAEDIRDLQCRTRHARRALSGRLGSLDLAGDMLQWAHHLADRLDGDAGIERRAIELGVPEQHLDHPDIDVLLEQVGGEAVPQGVQRYALVDLGPLGCSMTDAIELARRHRLHAVASWKQPAVRSCRPPPGTQQFEQKRREHHVAVFAAFALLDANDHALAVDVSDLERDHLGGAQACAISHAQRRLVLEPRRRTPPPPSPPFPPPPPVGDAPPGRLAPFSPLVPRAMALSPYFSAPPR